MSDLRNEIFLRLGKALAALLLGALLYLLATGPLGDPGGLALALLCWLSAAAFILLAQEGPI